MQRAANRGLSMLFTVDLKAFFYIYIIFCLKFFIFQQTGGLLHMSRGVKLEGKITTGPAHTVCPA